LTLEPWSPGYDTSLHDDLGQETISYEDLDLHVELEQWKAVQTSRADVQFSDLYFIDGRRRTEQRVFAQSEDESGIVRSVPGLLGTVAVGLAQLGSDGQTARVTRAEVHRVLILAEGQHHPDLRIKPEGSRLGELLYTFMPSVTTQDQIEFALQKIMQRCEASLAGSLSGQSGLLIVDGTLRGKPTFGASLGYVKTIHNLRLPPDEQRTLTSLLRGWRSPVFQIGKGKPGQVKYEPKYSWYLRLDDPIPWHHSMAGIVRLEVYAEAGLEFAKQVADWTCLNLPRLAARRFRDPRAPQQLMPVAFLESELGRRMGDAGIVRRRIAAHLHGLYAQTPSETVLSDGESTVRNGFDPNLN
jgi:hypothetical protein